MCMAAAMAMASAHGHGTGRWHGHIDMAIGQVPIAKGMPMAVATAVGG